MKSVTQNYVEFITELTAKFIKCTKHHIALKWQFQCKISVENLLTANSIAIHWDFINELLNVITKQITNKEVKASLLF